MAEFRMPSLGADMESGVLVEWKVTVGDTVKHGDVIAEIETDKGIIDIEVFEDGVIEDLVVEPFTKVPVGEVLAMIRGVGEVVTAPAVEAVSADKPPAPEVEEPHPMDHLALQETEVAPTKRVRVSPAARKLAAELGVDVTALQGSGQNGAITRADVEKAVQVEAEKPKVEKAPVPEKAKAPTADAQAGMRRAIAAAMSRSNQDIPHYYLETRIDMTKALTWLEAENLKRSIRERILPATLLVKAVARALVDVPELNAFWLEDSHQVQEAIHIGFAISLRQGGLVTPALHHADLKSLDELMVDMHDLIQRTRAGRLRSSDLTDATITLTNLGDMGVEKVFGVIYPPQVALVGFGKVTEQPWAENGMLGIRRIVTATLAADHRATDGVRGAQFLDALNRHLQEVEQL